MTIRPNKLRAVSSITANSTRPNHNTATVRLVEISPAAMSPAALAPM
jgi:hypothetical protein